MGSRTRLRQHVREDWGLSRASPVEVAATLHLARPHWYHMWHECGGNNVAYTCCREIFTANTCRVSDVGGGESAGVYGTRFSFCLADGLSSLPRAGIELSISLLWGPAPKR